MCELLNIKYGMLNLKSEASSRKSQVLGLTPYVLGRESSDLSLKP